MTADEANSDDAAIPVPVHFLTTNGLVGRYVTDWAGMNAVLRGVAIKLGGPNLPGDTMKMTGSVIEKIDTERLVKVEVAGRNSWGDHVTGTIELSLPGEA